MGTYVNRAISLARLITDNPAVILKNGREKVIYPDEKLSKEQRYAKAVATGEAARVGDLAKEALAAAVAGELSPDDIYFAVIAFVLFCGFLRANSLVRKELRKYELIKKVYYYGFESYGELCGNKELYDSTAGHFVCDAELEMYFDRYVPGLELSAENLCLIKASGSEAVSLAHNIACKVFRYWDRKITSGSNPESYISACINTAVIDAWRVKKPTPVDNTDPDDREDIWDREGQSNTVDCFAQADDKCCISEYFAYYIGAGKTDKLIALSLMYLRLTPREFISDALEDAFGGCEAAVDEALGQLGGHRPAGELADFAQSVIKSFITIISEAEDPSLREEGVEALASKISETIYKVKKELKKRFPEFPDEISKHTGRRGL